MRTERLLLVVALFSSASLFAPPRGVVNEHSSSTDRDSSHQRNLWLQPRSSQRPNPFVSTLTGEDLNITVVPSSSFEATQLVERNKRYYLDAHNLLEDSRVSVDTLARAFGPFLGTQLGKGDLTQKLSTLTRAEITDFVEGAVADAFGYSFESLRREVAKRYPSRADKFYGPDVALLADKTAQLDLFAKFATPILTSAKISPPALFSKEPDQLSSSERKELRDWILGQFKNAGSEADKVLAVGLQRVEERPHSLYAGLAHESSGKRRFEASAALELLDKEKRDKAAWSQLSSPRKQTIREWDEKLRLGLPYGSLLKLHELPEPYYSLLVSHPPKSGDNTASALFASVLYFPSPRTVLEYLQTVADKKPILASLDQIFTLLKTAPPSNLKDAENFDQPKRESLRSWLSGEIKKLKDSSAEGDREKLAAMNLALAALEPLRWNLPKDVSQATAVATVEDNREFTQKLLGLLAKPVGRNQIIDLLRHVPETPANTHLLEEVKKLRKGSTVGLTEGERKNLTDRLNGAFKQLSGLDYHLNQNVGSTPDPKKLSLESNAMAAWLKKQDYRPFYQQAAEILESSGIPLSPEAKKLGKKELDFSETYRLRRWLVDNFPTGNREADEAAALVVSVLSDAGGYWKKNLPESLHSAFERARGGDGRFNGAQALQALKEEHNARKANPATFKELDAIVGNGINSLLPPQSWVALSKLPAHSRQVLKDLRRKFNPESLTKILTLPTDENIIHALTDRKVTPTEALSAYDTFLRQKFEAYPPFTLADLMSKNHGDRSKAHEWLDDGYREARAQSDPLRQKVYREAKELIDDYWAFALQKAMGERANQADWSMIRAMSSADQELLLHVWQILQKTKAGRSVAENFVRFITPRSLHEVASVWDPQFYYYHQTQSTREERVEAVVKDFYDRARRSGNFGRIEDTDLERRLDEIAEARAIAYVVTDDSQIKQIHEYPEIERPMIVDERKRARLPIERKRLSLEVREAAAQRLMEDLAKERLRGRANPNLTPADTDALRKDPKVYALLGPIHRTPLLEQNAAEIKANPAKKNEIEKQTHELVELERDAYGEPGHAEKLVQRVAADSFSRDLIQACIAGLEKRDDAFTMEKEAIQLDRQAEAAEADGDEEEAKLKRVEARILWAQIVDGTDGLRLPPTKVTPRSEEHYQRVRQFKVAEQAVMTKIRQWNAEDAPFCYSVMLLRSKIGYAEPILKRVREKKKEIEAKKSEEKAYVKMIERFDQMIQRIQAQIDGYEVGMREAKANLRRHRAKVAGNLIEDPNVQGPPVPDEDPCKEGAPNQVREGGMVAEEMKKLEALRAELDATTYANLKTVDQDTLDGNFGRWAERCMDYLKSTGKPIPQSSDKDAIVRALKAFAEKREQAEAFFAGAHFEGGGKPDFSQGSLRSKYDALMDDLISGRHGIKMTRAEAKAFLEELNARADQRRKDNETELNATLAELKKFGIGWNGMELDYSDAKLVGVDMKKLKDLLIKMGNFGKYDVMAITAWDELKDYIYERYADGNLASKFEFDFQVATPKWGTRFRNEHLVVQVESSIVENLNANDDYKQFKFLDRATERQKAEALVAEIENKPLLNDGQPVLDKNGKPVRTDLMYQYEQLNRNLRDYVNQVLPFRNVREALTDWESKEDVKRKMAEFEAAMDAVRGKIALKADELRQKYGWVGAGPLPALLKGVDLHTQYEIDLVPGKFDTIDEVNDLIDAKLDYWASTAWSEIRTLPLLGLNKILRGPQYAERYAKLTKYLNTALEMYKGARMGNRVSLLQKWMSEDLWGDGTNRQPMDQFVDNAGRMSMLFGMAPPLTGALTAGMRHVAMPWWLEEGIAGGLGMGATNFAVETAHGVPTETAAWNSLKMTAFGIPVDRYIGTAFGKWLSKHPTTAFGTAAASAYLTNAGTSVAVTLAQWYTDPEFKKMLEERGITTAAGVAGFSWKQSLSMDLIATGGALARARVDIMKQRMLYDPNYTVATAEAHSKSRFNTKLDDAVSEMRADEIAKLRARMNPEFRDSDGKALSDAERARLGEFLDYISQSNGFGDTKSYLNVLDQYQSSGWKAGKSRQTVYQMESGMTEIVRKNARADVQSGKQSIDDMIKQPLFYDGHGSYYPESYNYIPADKLNAAKPEHQHVIMHAAMYRDSGDPVKGVDFVQSYQPKAGESLAQVMNRYQHRDLDGAKSILSDGQMSPSDAKRFYGENNVRIAMGSMSVRDMQKLVKLESGDLNSKRVSAVVDGLAERVGVTPAEFRARVMRLNPSGEPLISVQGQLRR